MARLTSIRSKLFALFLMTGAIPIVLVSLVAFRNSLQAVEEMVGNRTGRLALGVEGELARKLERRIEDRLLRVNRPVQAFLTASAAGDPAARRAAEAELVQYLPQLFASYEGFYEGLLLADAAGTPLLRFNRTVGTEGAWIARLAPAGSDLAPPPEGAGPSVAGPAPPAPVPEPAVVFTEISTAEAGRAALARVIALGAGGGIIGEEDRRAARLGADLGPDDYRLATDIPQSGGRRAVRLVLPIHDNAGRAGRIGVLVTDLRIDHLFREDLAAERFGALGEILVVDRETDEILFHSRADRIGKRFRLIDPPLAGAVERAAAGRRWIAAAGPEGRRLAVSRDLPNAAWRVIATAVPREFQGEAQRAGFANLLIASGALFLAGAVLLAASGRITSSIKTVTEGARRIAAGRLDHSIQVKTHDEIQILAEAFNQMTASLSESIALRERAARELEEINRTLEDRVQERTRALQELNEALNQANRELKELDRLKSNFLATVSHEFKTPLTSIKAFAEILLDEASELHGAGEMARFLGIIHSESERLGRLIKNLLSLSQIESGRILWSYSEFPVEQVVDAALDGLLPAFKEKGVRVEQRLACPRARVRADLDRIHEVITNLLENALKYTDREGAITIGCGPAPPFVQVTVRDAGPGIAGGHHETIFERFIQVDQGESRPRGGTGLGLAICREIVEHHGGRIWVESEPGQGAAFHFTLPLAGDRDPAGGARG